VPKFEHHATIPASPDKVWSFLMDIPSVAKCGPGVGSVEPLGDDKYRGTINVAFGPVRLALTGDVSITEKDEVAKVASMRAEAADKRAGGAVKAIMKMSLQQTPGNAQSTELTMDTDAQIMGRIGEFGQPLIRKKADDMVKQFAENLRQAIAERG
jgi:carbon monoxide dehydrogenase subunit G